MILDHNKPYATKQVSFVAINHTLLKPGSMLPESTTTTGELLPVIHINPFQIISAEATIIPEIQFKQEESFNAIHLKSKSTYVPPNCFMLEEVRIFASPQPKMPRLKAHYQMKLHGVFFLFASVSKKK